MPAPTLARPGQPETASPQTRPTPAMIPFTRAARKKSRIIGSVGPIALTAGTQVQAPIQIPANGYLRAIIADVTVTSAGNAAAVAFNNDGPFNILQQVSLAAANGDSLINPVDGFSLYVLNKYGAFSSQRIDPLASPTYAKTVGAVGAGGSARFQVVIPVEIDARDALGALPNMAANQAFLLQWSLNNLAGIYTVAPTNAPTVSVTFTSLYWAAPGSTNAAGIPQQTAPRVANAVNLVQTQQPPIVASTQQSIQLLNVGNTIRSIILIGRDNTGTRSDAIWPDQANLLVNNDYWYYKTQANWRNQMAQEYNLTAGGAPPAAPTLNSLDAGVYVITDFMNDGGSGCGVVSSSANRDLCLVTGSATALYFEAQSWKANATSLLVLTNSIRVPDPAAFYAPLGI